MMQVIVYSRPGCHLCEEAIQLLASHGLRAREVNIDENPELRSQYNTCVPVVEMDGKVRFRGHIDPVLLERLLAQYRSAPADSQENV
jgi:glutaredoxin